MSPGGSTRPRNSSSSVLFHYLCPRIFFFYRSATAAMRGSLFNRRTMQRFRQIAISTVGSVKIKLLLCICIGLTLIALASRAPGFLGWTGHGVSVPPLADSRFVQLILILLKLCAQLIVKLLVLRFCFERRFWI